MRRAVPPCCHAVLAQIMRAQHASNTTARTNYHTHLPSFKRPAITFGRTLGWRRRRWNQSRQRGAWNVSSNWVKIALIVSSLERPHRHGHRHTGTNTLSVGTNTLTGITKLPPPPKPLSKAKSRYRFIGVIGIVCKAFFGRFYRLVSIKIACFITLLD